MNDLDRLKKIIRFEIDPEHFDRDTIGDSFEGVYNITYLDLIEACKNMLRLEVDIGTVDDWNDFVTETIGEYYNIALDREDWRVALWGETDIDMIELLYFALDAISHNDSLFDYPRTLTDMLSQIVELAETHEYNKGHEVGEWKICPLQRNILIYAFDENIKHMTAPQKARYISIINEESEKEQIEAMRLKGYSCYGGNDLYKCDWEESRKLIKRLFDLTDKPQYAYKLGNICYYGQCNNGVPEYEKAFQYYSIGAASEHWESMYKLSDMFEDGKGCIKSQRASDYIIFKLYEDVRPRFLNGHDYGFADIALRKASIFKRDKDYYNAYKYYLEADYAFKEQLAKNDFIGYNTVQENITKSLNEIKTLMPDGFFVDELEDNYPLNLLDLLNDENEIRLNIKEMCENRYKFRFMITKTSKYRKIFFVYPELDGYIYDKSFECEVKTNKPICFYDNKTDITTVDNLVGEDCGEFKFYYKGKAVLFLSGATFIVRKEYISLRTKLE